MDVTCNAALVVTVSDPHADRLGTVWFPGPESEHPELWVILVRHLIEEETLDKVLIGALALAPQHVRQKVAAALQSP